MIIDDRFDDDIVDDKVCDDKGGYELSDEDDDDDDFWQLLVVVVVVVVTEFNVDDRLSRLIVFLWFCWSSIGKLLIMKCASNVNANNTPIMAIIIGKILIQKW